ncbi:RTA1 like protein-domain-containing protein [Aspergillus pseudodeflectus]|uniref:RTA1 like protein-domain-containing protein n=1 Tax=Aspergillus pseudodeflectus TaxID=176178 RepID=A0ABR4KA46_9EURO
MTDGFEDWQPYYYDPSMAAAVIFIILFGILTALHTYHLYQTRTWFFVPLILGGYFEVIGYIGRAISSSESPHWALGPYIMQSVLLLVAPALYAASIYMYLGRVIVLVRGEEFSLLHVSWMTKIFVAGDVLSFIMQSSGAGIIAKGELRTGEDIIVGGLFVQVIFFGFFVLCAVVFQRRLGENLARLGVTSSMPWKKHLWALYASSALILVRSVFRTVEYLQGYYGSLLQTEVYIYVFDAVLMWLVLVIFLVVHPSEVYCLLGRGRVMTTKGGLSITEVLL